MALIIALYLIVDAHLLSYLFFSSSIFGQSVSLIALKRLILNGIDYMSITVSSEVSTLQMTFLVRFILVALTCPLTPFLACYLSNLISGLLVYHLISHDFNFGADAMNLTSS